MADPTDVSSGLLSALDPQTLAMIRAFVAEMQPSQQTLHQAQMNKIADFGFGLMGARKGSEWQTIGNSGLNAMQNYNKDIAAQQAMQGQNVSQAMQMMGLARQNQTLQQDADLGKNIGRIAAAGAAPPTTLSGPAASFQQPGGAAALAGDAASGTTSPSNTLPTQQAPAPPSSADTVRALANQYRQYAQVYAQAGPRYATQFKEYAAAADALEKQLEYSTTPQTMMDKNNQPQAVLLNKSGGSMPVAGFSPKPEVHYADLGAGVQPINSLTQQPMGAMLPKSATPGEKMTNSLGYANLAESKRKTNLQYDLDAQGLPQGNTDEYAKMIANYDTPFPQAIMYRRPEMGAQLIAKVQAANPTYDAKNYPVAQATMTAFAKGKQGDTVRFIGNTLQHMDVLRQAADALNNGDYPLLNRLANAVGTQAGSSAPTTYNAIASVVGNEVVKAVVGSGGGVGDREKSQQILADFNNPKTVSGVLGGYTNLLGGQLSGLEQQYKAGTQRDDFAERFLTPQTQQLRASQKAGGTGAAPASSGTSVTAPDGTVLSFPSVAAATAFKKLHNLQ